MCRGLVLSHLGDRSVIHFVHAKCSHPWHCGGGASHQNLRKLFVIDKESDTGVILDDSTSLALMTKVACGPDCGTRRGPRSNCQHIGRPYPAEMSSRGVATYKRHRIAPGSPASPARRLALLIGGVDTSRRVCSKGASLPPFRHDAGRVSSETFRKRHVLR